MSALPPYGTLDSVAWSMWGAMVVFYHLAWGLRAWFRGTHHLHQGWVMRMARLEGGHVAVVQALRNVLLTATFAGILAYTYADAAATRILATRTSDGLSDLNVRDLALSIVLLVSFSNFFLSCRCLLFVGFALSEHIPQNTASTALAEAASPLNGRVAATMPLGGAQVESASISGDATYLKVCEAQYEQMMLHFSLGLRSFFCAMPLVLFAAGPIVFLVATVLTVVFLLYIDINGLT